MSNSLRLFLRLIALCMVLLLAACAAMPAQPPCPTDRQELPDCPPQDAIRDTAVEDHYQKRDRKHAETLDIDPIQLGMQIDVPANDAYGKIIGSAYEDSINSLAAKIWLVDNAVHTVDAMYYIFSRDLVGYAFLGALCEAVERGVDVRLMVDSLGSYHPTHSELKGLKNCAINGGFARNAAGEVTTRKARVQTMVFGAISIPGTNINRRSHDKLLITDGAFPDRAWVMTGGRNISLSYYGLKEDGSKDPNAYKDLEILLRAPQGSKVAGSVGQVSEHYASILMAAPDNKALTSLLSHRGQMKRAREDLQQLRAMPDFQRAYANMEDYLATDLFPARVRIAHELGNIVHTDVVANYDHHLEKNPNSIAYIATRLSELEPDNHTLRIVSPYLFVPAYERSDGSVYHDGAEEVEDWLDEHPDNRIEIITNSTLTSDNFFAQAIIDMDTAPRLLLDKETKKHWRKSLKKSELDPSLVESDHWRTLVANPRVKIYEVGRLDSDQLGGEVAYGKLHAKFFLTDDWAFVGTTNLDYRSRLFNNEMGFFFASEELRQALIDEFDELKSQSYRWGSPEWLQLRAAVRDIPGLKGRSASRQRKTFKLLRNTGLHWQF